MGGAIQKLEHTQQAANSDATKERRDLVKRTVAPDATDSELDLFLHIARESDLDPLRRQIHFMKHGGRVTIVADINGLQARAAREPDFEGIAHGVVYDGEEFVFNHAEQRVEKHTSNPFASASKKILGAWAIVFRKGKRPFADVSHFSEFTNRNNPLWASKPAVMMDKVAKSRALRLAYPEQLGGIYESAEVDAPEETTPERPPMSKPVVPAAAIPATSATREATPTLQTARDVVEAEVVPPREIGHPDARLSETREPGADDGDAPDDAPKGWEVWQHEIPHVTTREEYRRYATEAAKLDKGTEGRRVMSKLLTAADARLKAEGK